MKKGVGIPPKHPNHKNESHEVLYDNWDIEHHFKKVMQNQDRKCRLMNLHCDEFEKALQLLEQKYEKFYIQLQIYLEKKHNKEI